MRSADDSRDLFRAMFPDSKVAEKFSLGRTKASYIINYVLAKFFCSSVTGQTEINGIVRYLF